MSSQEKQPTQPDPSHPQLETAPAQYVQQQPAAQGGMIVGPGGNRNAKNVPMGADGREWSNGLFDCCDDSSTCLLACFCPSVVYSQNKQRFNHLSTQGTADPAHGGGFFTGDCMTYFCLNHLCFHAGAILGMWSRTAIRERYKISGSGLLDCLVSCYCVPCGLTQESRELELEEQSFGQGSKV